jgi:hypothetical protein
MVTIAVGDKNYPCHVAEVRGVNFESCGSTDGSDRGYIVMCCENGYVGDCEIGHFGQQGPALAALNIQDHCTATVENVLIKTNISSSCIFRGAGVAVGAAGHGTNGVFFKNVVLQQNGDGSGGPMWAWGGGTPDWFETGGAQQILRGASFEACNWDGALALNNLPQFPTSNAGLGVFGAIIGQEMTCTDSPTTVAGTVLSQVAATNGVTIPGDNVLHFATGAGFPSFVQAGWKVYGPTKQNQMFGAPTVNVGGINSGAGTITISAGGVWVSGPGVASGDIVSFFAPGGGANRVAVKHRMLTGGASVGWVVSA